MRILDLGSYVYPLALVSLSHAFGNFFIVARRLVSKAICPTIQCFPEAIINRADHRPLLFASASAFQVTVSRLLDVHLGAFCSTMVGILATLWSVFAFWLYFWEDFVLFFELIWLTRISSHIFVPALAVTTFGAHMTTFYGTFCYFFSLNGFAMMRLHLYASLQQWSAPATRTHDWISYPPSQYLSYASQKSWYAP